VLIFFIQVNPSDDADIKMLKNQQNLYQPFDLPLDANDLFDRGFREGPSKVMAAEAFNCLVSDLNLNLRQQSGILSFLVKNTRSLNLFVKPPTPSSIAADITTSSMSAYIEPDNRHTTIDCCRNGCMAFMGFREPDDKHQDPIDCSKLMRCLDCESPRFTPCTHPNCRGLSYDRCNKFEKDKAAAKDREDHSHQNRTPIETVFFRSTISKLAQLYCLSLTKNNDRLLKYHEDRCKRVGQIIDICDGTEVIKHQQIMADKFASFRAKCFELDPTVAVDECSLCLTFFYDGGVNYTRSSDSMWPLVTSVVNCNPSNRTKLGIGSSLSLLHNMAGSGVEKFLLKLYAKELKVLESGILFVVGGETAMEDRSVYLQARMMYLHADTKAVESLTCSKGSSSKMCTCCNLNVGIYHPILKKVSHTGNRNSINIDHLIRYVGEAIFEPLTEQDQVEDLEAKIRYDKSTAKNKGEYVKRFIVCTAEEHQTRYYAGDRSIFKHIVDATSAFVLDDSALEKQKAKLVNAEVGKGAIQYPADVRNVCAQENFVRSKLWYNQLFPYEKMAQHMRFPYVDTRKEVLYQHVDNDQYCFEGHEGEKQEAVYEADLARKIARGGERPKSKHDSSYNGRHGVCPLMEALLESFGFSNVSFDYMHYAANVFKYFILLMKGDRAVSDLDRKYSAASLKMPTAKYKNFLLPFQLLGSEEIVFDAVINSILISPLYKMDFAVKYPFQQTGHLKSHECHVIMMVYLTYALSFTRLHDNYQEFYARYAYDMTCLLNPCVDVKRLREEIIPSIYETRMCQEGLFPESECVYIFHEIIDIIHQIEKYGHVKSLMCFFGERAMGMIKSFVTKGGVHYMKTLYHRYIVKENSVAAQMTNNELFFTNDAVPKYSDFVIKLLGKGKTVRWHEKDTDEFFESLMRFIQSEVIDMIHEKSPFYRLYKAYEDNFKYQNKPMHFDGFSSWIRGLDIVFRSGDITKNQATARFVNDVLLTTEYDYEQICDGFIYLSDLIAVKDSILNFNPLVHEKLVTKGIMFNCRGHEYGALASVLEGDRKLLRFGMELKSSWHVRKQYSSFVRCTDVCVVDAGHIDEFTLNANGDMIKNKGPGGSAHGAKKRKHHASQGVVDEDIDELDIMRVYGEQTKFGQINSCWRTHMPGDKVVHGLAFANVTFRKTENDVKRRHHKILAHRGILGQKFICVNRIDSTSIGVSPIGCEVRHGKRVFVPMLKTENTQSFTQYSDASKQSSGAYAKRDTSLEELYLIELHPERVSFRYGDSYEDTDGTKLWEKKV
jgi:hypothetical protein